MGFFSSSKEVQRSFDLTPMKPLYTKESYIKAHPEVSDSEAEYESWKLQTSLYHNMKFQMNINFKEKGIDGWKAVRFNSFRKIRRKYSAEYLNSIGIGAKAYTTIYKMDLGRLSEDAASMVFEKYQDYDNNGELLGDRLGGITLAEFENNFSISTSYPSTHIDNPIPSYIATINFRIFTDNYHYTLLTCGDTFEINLEASTSVATLIAKVHKAERITGRDTIYTAVGDINVDEVKTTTNRGIYLIDKSDAFAKVLEDNTTNLQLNYTNLIYYSPYTSDSYQYEAVPSFDGSKEIEGPVYDDSTGYNNYTGTIKVQGKHNGSIASSTSSSVTNSGESPLSSGSSIIGTTTIGTIDPYFTYDNTEIYIHYHRVDQDVIRTDASVLAYKTGGGSAVHKKDTIQSYQDGPTYYVDEEEETTDDDGNTTTTTVTKAYYDTAYVTVEVEYYELTDVSYTLKVPGYTPTVPVIAEVTTEIHPSNQYLYLKGNFEKAQDSGFLPIYLNTSSADIPAGDSAVIAVDKKDLNNNAMSNFTDLTRQFSYIESIESPILATSYKIICDIPYLSSDGEIAIMKNVEHILLMPANELIQYASTTNSFPITPIIPLREAGITKLLYIDVDAVADSMKSYFKSMYSGLSGTLALSLYGTYKDNYRVSSIDELYNTWVSTDTEASFISLEVFKSDVIPSFSDFYDFVFFSDDYYYDAADIINGIPISIYDTDQLSTRILDAIGTSEDSILPKYSIISEKIDKLVEGELHVTQVFDLDEAFTILKYFKKLDTEDEEGSYGAIKANFESQYYEYNAAKAVKDKTIKVKQVIDTMGISKDNIDDLLSSLGDPASHVYSAALINGLTLFNKDGDLLEDEDDCVTAKVLFMYLEMLSPFATITNEEEYFVSTPISSIRALQEIVFKKSTEGYSGNTLKYTISKFVEETATAYVRPTRPTRTSTAPKVTIRITCTNPVTQSIVTYDILDIAITISSYDGKVTYGFNDAMKNTVFSKVIHKVPEKLILMYPDEINYKLSYKDYCYLYSKNLYLWTYSRVVIEVKWYQKAFFGFILIIVAVALIITGVGAAAGSALLTTITQLAVGMMLSYGLSITFPNMPTIIKTIIVIIGTYGAGNFNPAAATTTSASATFDISIDSIVSAITDYVEDTSWMEFASMASTGVSQGYNYYMEGKMKDLVEDYADFNNYITEKFEEISIYLAEQNLISTDSKIMGEYLRNLELTEYDQVYLPNWLMEPGATGDMIAYMASADYMTSMLNITTQPNMPILTPSTTLM